MNTKELAHKIHGALLDHASNVNPLRLGDRSYRDNLQAERESIIARLIEADRPTIPLPAAVTGATDPKVLADKLLAETIIFTIEGTMVGNTDDKEKVARLVENYMVTLNSMTNAFKRAVRDEAFAEFTEGARAADDMLAGTIGDKNPNA